MIINQRYGVHYCDHLRLISVWIAKYILRQYLNPICSMHEIHSNKALSSTTSTTQIYVEAD